MFFICCFCAVKAQNAASVFSSVPDKILLPLDSIQRLDIVDLYNAGRVAQIINNLGDTSRLVSLNENYLVLETENFRFEMALVPMINDSKIICIIKTVCAPVCDSRVSFYTTDWKRMDSGVFFKPVEKDWFILEGIDRNDEYFKTFEYALDMDLMRFGFENDGLLLVQTYTAPQYLSLDIRGKTDKYLKSEPKKYTWNKIRYE